MQRMIITSILILIPALVGTLPSVARDTGQYAHDPETSQWFRSIKNESGVPCCDNTDAIRLEDPDDYKRNEDDSYDVRVEGQSVHIDATRVIKGSNRVGYAIIWKYRGGYTCFLPGAGI